jgi:hypothetical protein
MRVFKFRKCRTINTLAGYIARHLKWTCTDITRNPHSSKVLNSLVLEMLYFLQITGMNGAKR